MKKLDHKWDGPFQIVAKEGHSFRLRLPNSWKTHPVYAPELLRKQDPPTELVRQDRELDARDPDTELEREDAEVEREDDREYKVQKVVASRRFRSKLEYKIEWVGFDKDLE